jgi:hypothetical protein
LVQVHKTILFYNTMWDLPLDYPRDAIPSPYVITTDRSAAEDAVAIVFHLPTLPPDLVERQLTKRKGQLWVAWCLECDLNLPQMAKPSFMNRFDITMTYQLDSDVVMTYLEPNFPELLRRPPKDKEDGKLLNAFISSSWNQSGRIEFLLQLMPHVDVHSCGRVFRNRSLSDDCGRKTKLETIKAYKFTLALENAIAKDYVTEKFYDPLIAGSVPVYLGAPNIDDFAPGERCFINAADWRSPEALARYLIEVSRDEDLYASYLLWKERPFRSQFQQLFELTREHPFVRLCRTVDARLRDPDTSTRWSASLGWFRRQFRNRL